jgi:hypothetical protein
MFGKGGWQLGCGRSTYRSLSVTLTYFNLTPPPHNPTSNPSESIPSSLGPEITTPIQGNQVMLQFRKRKCYSIETQLFIRKIRKGFNTQTFQITQRDLRIKTLKAENKQLRLKKQKKVIPNPNKQWVEIQQIAKAQAEATAALQEEEANKSNDEEERAEECIYVRN